MSKITFSENHESLLISFEEGQALASMQDPHAEALKWVYSLGAFPSQHVVIAGLGSGFHISALADLDPTVQITVVDSREALIPVFKSQFPELAKRVNILISENIQDLMKSDLYAEVVRDRAYVISFRECWGSQMNLFSEFFAHLTGRTAESVRFHFAEMGINLKALYFQNDNLLSIKDVLPAVEASLMAENKKQIFRVLGELVK